MRIVEKHRAVVGEKALRLRVEFEFGIAGDDDILLRAQAALDHSAAIFDPADQRQVEIAVALLISSFAIARRSEEHTSELQSLMRISYAVFCLKKKTK